MAVDVKPDPRALGENPLIEGLERLPVPATTLTIFGATGDLAHRKLLPALYNLAHEGALPERFNLIGDVAPGDARRGLPRGRAAAIQKYSRREHRRTVLGTAASRVRYVGFTFADVASYANQAFKRIEARLVESRAARPAGNRAVLSVDGRRSSSRRSSSARGTPSSTAGPTTSTWSRVIIEKPFGRDLESARASCNAQVRRASSDESQVYRIDHYLGKETVQNILAFRFANRIFEPLWNRKYIDHVQITVAEDARHGGTRGGYYDDAGALRDMVQNHMLQLLTLVGDGAAGRVRGRRGARREGEGAARHRAVDADGGAEHRPRRSTTMGERAASPWPATCEEDGVARRLAHARPTWRSGSASTTGAGRACRSTCAPGKRLPQARHRDRGAVQAPSPHVRVPAQGDGRRWSRTCSCCASSPTRASRCRFAPRARARRSAAAGDMDFRYGAAFGPQSPEAYERLFLDAMLGDSTLFTRRDEVVAQWAIIDPILKAWAPTTGRCTRTSPAPPARRRPTS